MSASSVLFKNCTPSFCTGNEAVFGPSIQQTLETSAESSATADFGFAEAHGELITQNGLQLPRLTGRATNEDSGLYWNRASVTIIEGYHYSGSTNKTFVFGASVSATTTITQSAHGLRASAYFFRASNFVYQTHLPTLINEDHAQVITNVVLTVLATNSGVLLSNAIEVTFTPGETVYLLAQLSASNFQQGGGTWTAQPFEVSCHDPSGLVAESLRIDLPLSMGRRTNAVEISWPATRRICHLESSSVVPSPTWEEIIAPAVGVTQIVLPTGTNSQFFRMRIE